VFNISVRHKAVVARAAAKRKQRTIWLLMNILTRTMNILGSMQGMFGASVSELYLLVIEDSRSMCDHQKRNTHAYTGTVSQAWL